MLEAIVVITAIIVLLIIISGTQKADAYVSVKSRQTLEKYDAIRFFKENRERLTEAENTIQEKKGSNEGTYKIRVRYVSPAGRKSAVKDIVVQQRDIDMLKRDPSLLMVK